MSLTLKFEEIPITTKTIIAYTNLRLNVDNMFKSLPIIEYNVLPKKRGRKKKNEIVKVNEDIDPGSIRTLKLSGDIRGADLSKKKKSEKTYFRNSLVIDMKVSDKWINAKVSKNGKFHLTGCKSDRHAIEFLKYITEHIKNIDNGETNYFTEDNEDISSVFVSVMSDIVFDLGFTINREKLDLIINTHTQHNSLLETNFGYTGVNMKMKMEKPMEIDLCKITYTGDEWVLGTLKYPDFLETLTLKEQEKSKNAKRKNTFLIFHSGKVIMSGIHPVFMEDSYHIFKDIVTQYKNNIEEKLE